MQTETTNDLLNKMEVLIKQLATAHKPKIEQTGPVGTTLDILGMKELSLTQRSILLYLVFGNDSDTKQKTISDYLRISMKCTRENCESLMELGYVKRGARASTWSLV